jgi:YVTN family beta-propeller protein
MTRPSIGFVLKAGVFVAAVFLTVSVRATLQDRGDLRQQGAVLPSGHTITPVAVQNAVQLSLNPGLPAYPDFVAGQAVRSALSPDGTTLAVITAGQNSLYKADGTVDAPNSTQYVFLYDVQGDHKQSPALLQVLKQTNAHVGLAFAPDGDTLYATGGSDDAVYVYTRGGNRFSSAGSIPLGHYPPGATGNARQTGLGIRVQPNAAGLDVSADGKTLVVANNYNDSISVIDTASRRVRYEHDLRPYFAGNEGRAGLAGGTFPFAVVMKGNGVAYVSSDRDREVVAIDVSSPTAGRLLKRVAVEGNALGMTLDAAESRLYVAQDNADRVSVIDTARNQVVASIDTRGPAGMLPSRRYTGAATSAVTISPDGRTLYAVNGGANAIAVVPLTGSGAHRVSGLIPTAYEPHDLTFSADGSWMYIVSGKSVTGPNPRRLSGSTGAMTSRTYPGGNTAAVAAARAANQYQFQLERASVVSAPVPDAAALRTLTEQVASNNFYRRESDERDRQVMAFLRRRIKHVIYVIKENRTFDQVLGDLTNGAKADPALAQFGAALTPNSHRMATEFATLDNFMNPGDGSMDGWSWALQGRVTTTEAITQQLNYAAVNRGLSYETEGANRNVPVNFPTVAERDAASGPAGTTIYSRETAGLPGGTLNLLTGARNHASTDAPFGFEDGYVFSAVLAAGGTVRNYGLLVDNIGSIGTKDAPVKDPFGAGIIQVAPLDPALAPLTDRYFRGYDQNYPDLWRYHEWKREFDQFVAKGTLPSLSLVRLSHDHMGAFATALAGVNTPETQQADCDLALGLMVEAVAKSRYGADTLFIVVEDDVQDGPDHVDSHRGPAWVVGPYVKKKVVVSTRYSQVNALRTIEDILGTEHLNLNTALQPPMTGVFDIAQSPEWTFTAEASTVLATTALSLTDGGRRIAFAAGPMIAPRHGPAYWDRVTAGFDFTEADQVPTARFNRLLWTGLMGDRPYPVRPLVAPAARAK